MAVTPRKAFAPSQLGAGAGVLYTCPLTAVKTARVLKLTATNSTGSAATVTFYLVPAAGSPGVTNIVTSAVSVPAGSTYEAFEVEGQMLGPGDTLQGLAGTASAITVAGAVVEFN